ARGVGAERGDGDVGGVRDGLRGRGLEERVTSATPDAALETGRFGLGRLTRLSGVRDYGIVFSFVALFITLSFASNVFFTHENLIKILVKLLAYEIIAVGG